MNYIKITQPSYSIAHLNVLINILLLRTISFRVENNFTHSYASVIIDYKHIEEYNYIIPIVHKACEVIGIDRSAIRAAITIASQTVAK